MPDLAEQLRALVDAAAEPLSLDEIVARPRAGRRRRGRLGVGAAILTAAAVIAAVVAGVLAVPRGRHSQHLVTGAPPMPSLIVAWRSDFGLVVLSSATGEIIRTLDSQVALVRALPTVTVTPDASTVYYSRSRRPAPGECPAGLVDEIARVPIGGGAPESVAPGVNPAISPDGRFLAYTRDLDSPCGTNNSELVVRDLRSGGELTWVSPQNGAIIDLSLLSWSSDSTHLGFYVTTRSPVPAPELLNLLRARTLDDATPIPEAPGTWWAGFMGDTGSSLAVRTPASGSGVPVVRENPATGAVQRDLFTVPDGLATSNAGDGPEDTLRSDPSGRYILAAARDGLYEWTDGQSAPAPRLLAPNTLRVTWATAQPQQVACPANPVPVPPASVPADVERWAQNQPVIGSRALWTVRSALDVPPVKQNGAWDLKFPWYLRPPGPAAGLPTITGRRLDGAGSFRADVSSATDATGTWAASSLVFSTPGCWEVIGAYRGSTITFWISVSG